MNFLDMQSNIELAILNGINFSSSILTFLLVRHPLIGYTRPADLYNMQKCALLISKTLQIRK